MFCRRPHYPKNWGLTAFTRPSMVMVRLVAPYRECPHIQRTVYVCSGVGRGARPRVCWYPPLLCPTLCFRQGQLALRMWDVVLPKTLDVARWWGPKDLGCGVFKGCGLGSLWHFLRHRRTEGEKLLWLLVFRAANKFSRSFLTSPLLSDD
jgi:hypothetical protein